MTPTAFQAKYGKYTASVKPFYKKKKVNWRDYLVPTHRPKENVSQNIDKIFYIDNQ